MYIYTYPVSSNKASVNEDTTPFSVMVGDISSFYIHYILFIKIDIYVCCCVSVMSIACIRSSTNLVTFKRSVCIHCIYRKLAIVEMLVCVLNIIFIRPYNRDMLFYNFHVYMHTSANCYICMSVLIIYIYILHMLK